MNLLYASPGDPAPWRAAVARHLPGANFFVHGADDYDPAAVDYALVWQPAPEWSAGLANVKAVFNLGAGVDALLGDPALPGGVPIVRVVDPRLAQGMTEYVVHWVLHFHRDMHVYARQQRARQWTQHANADPATRRVGILGLGELGSHAAHALLMLGFESVAGWSRTPKELPGVESFSGDGGLAAFLARTEILVNLLPDTPATRGVLNADTLALLPRGAFLINAGRGATVVEVDLTAALEDGRIQAAALDVFAAEPLPADHPLWGMDNVYVTPHVASLTDADSACRVVRDGIEEIEAGGQPENVVDPARGY